MGKRGRPPKKRSEVDAKEIIQLTRQLRDTYTNNLKATRDTYINNLKTIRKELIAARTELLNLREEEQI